MLDFVVNEVAKLVPGLPIETIQVGTIYVSELSDQNCLLTLKGQLTELDRRHTAGKRYVRTARRQTSRDVPWSLGKIHS